MNKTNSTEHGAIGSHKVADATNKAEQLLAGLMAFFLFAGIPPQLHKQPIHKDQVQGRKEAIDHVLVMCLAGVVYVVSVSAW